MSFRVGRRREKVQTALTPYSTRRNRQIISVPGHSIGLSINRTVRLNVTSSTTGGFVTYNAVKITFQQELGILPEVGAFWSFTPQRVALYGMSRDTYTLGIYNEPHVDIDNLPDGNMINAILIKAVDSCLDASIATIVLQIPQVATYTIDARSVKSLSRPFLMVKTEDDRQSVIIDVTGQFTFAQKTSALIALELNLRGATSGTENISSDTEETELPPDNTIIKTPKELSSNLERINPPFIHKSYKMSRMSQHSL